MHKHCFSLCLLFLTVATPSLATECDSLPMPRYLFSFGASLRATAPLGDFGDRMDDVGKGIMMDLALVPTAGDWRYGLQIGYTMLAAESRVLDSMVLDIAHPERVVTTFAVDFGVPVTYSFPTESERWRTYVQAQAGLRWLLSIRTTIDLDIPGDDQYGFQERLSSTHALLYGAAVGTEYAISPGFMIDAQLQLLNSTRVAYLAPPPGDSGIPDTEFRAHRGGTPVVSLAVGLKLYLHRGKVRR